MQRSLVAFFFGARTGDLFAAAVGFGAKTRSSTTKATRLVSLAERHEIDVNVGVTRACFSKELCACNGQKVQNNALFVISHEIVSSGVSITIHHRHSATSRAVFDPNDPEFRLKPQVTKNKQQPNNTCFMLRHVDLMISLGLLLNRRIARTAMSTTSTTTTMMVLCLRISIGRSVCLVRQSIFLSVSCFVFVTTQSIRKNAI